MCMILLVALGNAIPLQGPVIGIFTQDSPYGGHSDTYIAASYVKWLEAAGAQVVPIFCYSSQAQLQSLLGKLNGVLFPGGGMQIDISNKWTKNARFIFDKARQFNDRGDYFPIFFTCLGFQTLSYFANNNVNPLSSIANQDAIVRPLVFGPGGNLSLFQGIKEKTLALATGPQGLYYFNHAFCVLSSTFKNSSSMSSFLELITTSKNIKGVQFVSFVQAKKYPFFGSQFHPEKNNFQYRLDANRTSDGIEASLFLADRFVELARRSQNSFQGLQELESRLILNFNTSVLPKDKSSFSQVYIFQQEKEQ